MFIHSLGIHVLPYINEFSQVLAASMLVSLSVIKRQKLRIQVVWDMILSLDEYFLTF